MWHINVLSQSITCCCPCLSVVDWLPEAINIFPPFSVYSLQIGQAEVVAVVSMVVAVLPAAVLVVATSSTLWCCGRDHMQWEEVIVNTALCSILFINSSLKISSMKLIPNIVGSLHLAKI